jgi:hypothetical protein
VTASRDTWAGASSAQENAGWIAGGVIIAAIFVVGAVFWFTYHPMAGFP